MIFHFARETGSSNSKELNKDIGSKKAISMLEINSSFKHKGEKNELGEGAL